MSGPLVDWDMNRYQDHKRIWVDAPTHRTAKMQAAAEGVTLEAYIRRLVAEGGK